MTAMLMTNTRVLTMLTDYQQIAGMIDHSLLKPTITIAELDAGCKKAVEYNVASVCIMPHYLEPCAKILAGTSTKASTTIGFPHGGHTTGTKIAEVHAALKDGGQELDIMVNISRVLSGDWNYVRDEIERLTKTTHDAGQKVKIIFENCYLNDDQKIRLCEICGELGTDWVKTSTGFGTGGATDDDLRLMRKHSPEHVQVKAAGGVRTLQRLLEVRDIGVTRVGATTTFEILDEFRGSS